MLSRIPSIHPDNQNGILAGFNVTCFFFAFAHRNNSGRELDGLANIAVIGVFAYLTRSGAWDPYGSPLAGIWPSTGERAFSTPFPTAARYWPGISSMLPSVA